MDSQEMLSNICVSVAVSSVTILLFVNVYFCIRQRFPTKVNCWFCDFWCFVPYHNRNSFNCPSCEQYNGFKRDGSYNKEILEQSRIINEKLKPLPGKTFSNGLCQLCNDTQALKMQHINNFVPRDENNFDQELKQYRNELEEIYNLCPRCDQFLKKKLYNESKRLLGLKFLLMDGSPFRNINLHPPKELLKEISFQMLLAKVLNSIIFASATFILVYVLITNEYIRLKFLLSVILKVFLPLVNIFLYIFNGIFQIMDNDKSLSIGPSTFLAISSKQLENTIDLTFLSMVSLLIQIVASHLQRDQKHAVRKLVPWASLIFLTYLKPSNVLASGFSFFAQVVSCLFVILMVLLTNTYTASNQSKTIHKKQTRTRRNTQYSYEEPLNYEPNVSNVSQRLPSSFSSYRIFENQYSPSYLNPYASSFALKHVPQHNYGFPTASLNEFHYRSAPTPSYTNHFNTSFNNSHDHKSNFNTNERVLFASCSTRKVIVAPSATSTPTISFPEISHPSKIIIGALANRLSKLSIHDNPFNIQLNSNNCAKQLNNNSNGSSSHSSGYTSFYNSRNTSSAEDYDKMSISESGY